MEKKMYKRKDQIVMTNILENIQYAKLYVGAYRGGTYLTDEEGWRDNEIIENTSEICPETIRLFEKAEESIKKYLTMPNPINTMYWIKQLPLLKEIGEDLDSYVFLRKRMQIEWYFEKGNNYIIDMDEENRFWKLDVNVLDWYLTARNEERLPMNFKLLKFDGQECHMVLLTPHTIEEVLQQLLSIVDVMFDA